MAKGLLKSGAKPAHGGRRPNSGRKPDWLKERCKKLIDRKQLLNYVARVASGEETEQQVVTMREGTSTRFEVVDVKCSTKDRLHAIEILLERSFGKAPQAVQLQDQDGNPPVWNIKIVGVGGV